MELFPRICSRSASTRSGFPQGPNNFERSINAATTRHFASEARGIRTRFTPTPPSAVVTQKIARFLILCSYTKYLVLDPYQEIRSRLRLFLRCWPHATEILTLFDRRSAHVSYTLLKLRKPWAVIQGANITTLATLPNLEKIHVKWDSECNWLRATIGKLNRHLPSHVWTRPDRQLSWNSKASHSPRSSERSVFTLSQSWTPNYSSPPVFTQMTKLEIEFSCPQWLLVESR